MPRTDWISNTIPKKKNAQIQKDWNPIDTVNNAFPEFNANKEMSSIVIGLNPPIKFQIPK